jgi:uncharacterized membrane protein YbhN (UPF0104 family)
VQIGAVAVLAYLALRLHTLWREQPADLSDFDLPLLAAAALLSLAAVIAYGAVWPTILRRLGVPVPKDAVRLFLQSQLGKYVPGSVWHYAGRVGLARARGVAARFTLLSLGIEVAASTLSAALVGLLLLPPRLAVPLMTAVAAILVLGSVGRPRTARRLLDPVLWTAERVVRVPRSQMAPALRALPVAAALYVPVWAVYGTAFWLTARALFPVPAGELAYFTAAFALGWIAGMVVVFAPGGIGVREAVLVALVAPRIGHTEAIVVAGASRVLLTGADLAGGGAALALSRLGARGPVSLPREVESGPARPS